jgi:hypothetical protein
VFSYRNSTLGLPPCPGGLAEKVQEPSVCRQRVTARPGAADMPIRFAPATFKQRPNGFKLIAGNVARIFLSHAVLMTKSKDYEQAL